MKCQTLLLVAAALVPSVLADKPKLNQYRTMDDWYAAIIPLPPQTSRCLQTSSTTLPPVSGRCYNLDDATGAFFWNTGGMLNPRVYTGKNCHGTEDPLSTRGRCYNKGVYRSYKCW
ncbi:uncharacterized protein B0H64DRAFT_371966 [Chaetomium fimeti]|uniref:Uncharacterized protein n=1 Tax=Chaetomium fimeti TaxID=1854472 RepID=A0AAE0HN71_9PEZI|nr:hypothetical protein B0H64DRAFT_371966 [Chaetomium fimeti]